MLIETAFIFLLIIGTILVFKIIKIIEGLEKRLDAIEKCQKKLLREWNKKQ